MQKFTELLYIVSTIRKFILDIENKKFITWEDVEFYLLVRKHEKKEQIFILIMFLFS